MVAARREYIQIIQGTHSEGDLNCKRAGNCKKGVEKVPKFDSLKGHHITYIETRIRRFFLIFFADQSIQNVLK